MDERMALLTEAQRFLVDRRPRRATVQEYINIQRHLGPFAKFKDGVLIIARKSDQTKRTAKGPVNPDPSIIWNIPSQDGRWPLLADVWVLKLKVIRCGRMRGLAAWCAHNIFEAYSAVQQDNDRAS